jgi:hypothetical protein
VPKSAEELEKKGDRASQEGGAAGDGKKMFLEGLRRVERRGNLSGKRDEIMLWDSTYYRGS